MGRAAQHTTRHGGQRASSSVERGVGGDSGRANVDADSRGRGKMRGEREEGKQRVAREKVERWREGELAREYGEGERRRGSGKRGDEQRQWATAARGGTWGGKGREEPT